MDSKESCSFKILMFPWLAHGHIFPYLELAKRLSQRKSFHIYICSTAVNLPSIAAFLRSNSLQNSIETLELRLEPNPNLPPHLHTTKNLPSHLNTTLLKAFQTSKPSFSDIIGNLRPNLLIYDVFQPWAPTLSLSLGIPAVHFSPFGAASTSYALHRYSSDDPNPPFPELSLEEHESRSFDTLMEFLKVHVFDHDKDANFINYKLSTEVVLLKTCAALEPRYLDYVSSESRKRILAVGPLAAAAGDEREGDSRILKWLSEKPPNSTVYVSFGSECFLTATERAEIAKGLELCKANFIWVIRFPAAAAAAEEEEAVPRGFLERVGERGVVTEWAPQVKVLGHPSVGAFVSHCGWSSVCESVYYGVPVVAMPMKLNMAVDAKMMVGAGAGVEIRRGEDGVYRGEEIGRAIVEVVEGEAGERMRERVRELSERMRMEEGEAIDEAAEVLWKICSKYKGNLGNED